ncbi:MAG: 16S rRNA (adenine(1518)-N(6)/adenine(1519)-N(6))-dimethyltransferase RsmA [Gammaproteobacteria bacterium]|nr:16S rRNA (adenine(1518)-N(6)/adenine(1519)-N(6))-dimethyltransferase RsmA [Gammaproteobacteria bacterium]
MIARIHDALSVQQSDKVIEIGPGRGALTTDLAEATSNLTLIELDRDFATDLQRRFPNAELHSMDVLDVPLESFAERRVVGNLPYNISTALLIRLLMEPRIVDMHFMLQTEVALRLAASPGEKAWGRISVMAQYRCQIQPLFAVPASSFRPVPKVESMFVRLTPRAPKHAANDFQTYSDVVRSAFSQRRKTLANSLSSYEISWERLELDSRMRADHASVDDYVFIANSIDFQ